MDSVLTTVNELRLIHSILRACRRPEVRGLDRPKVPNSLPRPDI